MIDWNNGSDTVPCSILEDFPLDIPDRVLEILENNLDFIPSEVWDCAKNNCWPSWLYEVCPQNKNDFPQEYFPPPLQFNFSAAQGGVSLDDFEMGGFLVAESAYAFYYGVHYFFGGEDLLLQNKKYNDWVFRLEGNELKKSNIKLSFASALILIAVT